MDAQSRLRKSAAVVVLALGLTVSATASAKHQSQAIGNFDVEDRQDIEEIVREYILNHPEVLLESVQRLQAQERLAQEQQRRESAGAVKPVDSEDHILGDPDAPVKLIDILQAVP
jgi:protein-disulfide isomerase